MGAPYPADVSIVIWPSDLDTESAGERKHNGGRDHGRDHGQGTMDENTFILLTQTLSTLSRLHKETYTSGTQLCV